MAAVPFPLVEIRSVANGQNEWVALSLGDPGQGLEAAALQQLFGTPDLLAAVAPLDCIVPLDDPAILTPAILDLLPPSRVLLLVRAGDASAAPDAAAPRLAELRRSGYRVLVDGVSGAAGRMLAVARDCRRDAPPPASLQALFGPHLAYGVDTLARFGACENAGFDWFSGDYPLDASLDDGDDGTSRRRLLTMLALLARDADTHELEAQLRQDAALSYHLLKLVNSAALSGSVQVASFGQAIARLGRRQLQRWLQLLLYARVHPNSPPNLMLPLAARRGAMLEALSRHDGADEDAHDLAFMTGAFSLLDRLFHMPMDAIVRELVLPRHVQAALVRREGALGQRLDALDAGVPDAGLLARADVAPGAWWHSQLHACHWAIQVARNV